MQYFELCLHYYYKLQINSLSYPSTLGWSWVTVKHAISLVLNLLSEPKSVPFLLKDPIFMGITFNPLELCLNLISVINLHSVRILLYTSKAWGFALIAFTRSNHAEMLLGKGVLKICSKYTGEHSCRSAISINFAKQLYWNHTSAWVFSSKFAAYFQKTFS